MNMKIRSWVDLVARGYAMYENQGYLPSDFVLTYDDFPIVFGFIFICNSTTHTIMGIFKVVAAFFHNLA